MADGTRQRHADTCAHPAGLDQRRRDDVFLRPAAQRVEWVYIENLGGVSHGSVESANGVLTFPATQYVADGKSMTYRARWTPIGTDAYEAWSEARNGDAWTTMCKLTLKQSS